MGNIEEACHMNKNRVFKPVLFSLLTVLGILIALMLRYTETGQKYVRIQDLYLLKSEIKSDKGAIEQYKSSLTIKKEYLDKYNQYGIKQSESVLGNLEKELEKHRAMSGDVDLIGEGVVVIVTDSDRELMASENENDIIVHDVNIIRLVDDLFAAGAEAISINDNRILMNKRDIICNGPTIRVNNSLVSQPFVIKAIGDREYLKAAINAPGKYGAMLREIGIYLEVNPSMNVEVKKFGANLGI